MISPKKFWPASTLRLTLLALSSSILSCGYLHAADLSKKDYEFRWKAALKIINTEPVNWIEFESAARALIKDYPSQPNGYCDLMILIGHFEQTDRRKAAELAKEMTGESIPEKYRFWAEGCLRRLDASDKPYEIQFTAVDGREVDLAKMKGKVVLVEFWSTRCTPCIADMPAIKAAYDKFHEQGFEIIGVNFDTDPKALLRFVKKKSIAWPQYNDGKQYDESKLGQQFGVNGIPHLFLIDKKGNLHFDNVRANGDLDKKIETLLHEQSSAQK